MKATNMKNDKSESGEAVRCSARVGPGDYLARILISNLALGRGCSHREREAVLKNSARLDCVKASLRGQKQKSVPILQRLVDSRCGCPESGQ